MKDAQHYFRADDLRRFATDIFRHWEMSERDADIVARVLVSANLRGVDTHGVARIPAYIERFRKKIVEPRPAIRVTSRMPWAADLDGANGMGPVVAQAAMDEVLKRVETLGIGVATARRSNHFGHASYYALQAVERGCVGICLSPASRSLAPFGSRQPFLGTNPIAVAMPAGAQEPWSMDMATSVAARGHIRLAARHGEPIPEGWALDVDGNATTDAEKAMRGVMLPFAGAKGSAIAMMIDILGGVLAGSAFGGEIRDMNFDFEAPQDVGHFFLAFKVEALMPLAEFNARMDAEIARLKALEPAAGFSEILYPGEPEARKEAERLRNGIPLSQPVLDSLQPLADECGLKLPAPIAGDR
jgi:L-2-hydroxycarboxylate dehydrogenase (NAD+)